MSPARVAHAVTASPRTYAPQIRSSPARVRSAVVAVAAVSGLLATAPPASAATRPDLVVGSVSKPPVSKQTGARFSITDVTKNRGKKKARRSTTRYYLSLDQRKNRDDRLVNGSRSVPALAPGQRSRGAAAVTIPPTTRLGTYFVLACADDLRKVTESSNRNNCRSSTSTLIVEQPPSSQDLIAEDLDAGIIDYPTSLEYRTWALFRDLQLPARYADMPSAGEDQSLFDELDSEFDSLPTDVQAAVEPYLVPPNDPASAFGPAPPVTPRRDAVTADTGSDSADTRCHLPATWRPEEWTPPGGGVDDGFLIWVCAASDAEAAFMTDPVIAAASQLWEPMTRSEPDGMGKPVPSPGKIRIFILHTSDCVDRTCPLFDPDDPNSFRLGVERTLPETCHTPGYPPRSCSGSIALNAGEVCPTTMPCFAALKGVLAHEFFHVLQDAHNADAVERKAGIVNGRPIWDKSWYYEASAEWAAWHYADDPRAKRHFESSFQTNNSSLLRVGDQHEYGSWVWPLMMQQELDPSAVFQSWLGAESAADPQGIDDAIDGIFGFEGNFRDFSVRNLNASEYFAGGGSGLEADIWQTELPDFSRKAHTHDPKGVVGLGDQELFVEVEALAAQDDEFDIKDPNVRQVTIDVASLANASSADIDVVGRLAPDDESGPPTWSRIRGSGTSLTFCRDFPTQDFDLIYVVLSNHARVRASLGGPDPDAALSGAYQITGKNACDVPDHFDGTFSGFMGERDVWSGHATFDLLTAASSCTDPLHDPPTPTDLHYCYRLTGGDVQWSWTPNDGCTYAWDEDAPNPGTFPLVPEPFDQDFATKVDLVIRSPDPDDVGTYGVSISPYPRLANQMRGSVTCDGDTSRITRFANNLEGAWLHTGFSESRDIGTGWELVGSVRLCAPDDPSACQGWTWDFQPRWDEE
jgi:hypothetical protein